jgi:hypothetical protein
MEAIYMQGVVVEVFRNTYEVTTRHNENKVNSGIKIKLRSRRVLLRKN